MTYYYVYETTNLINDKKYIGWHQTDFLDDKYIGSGRRLQMAIKKYGQEHFKRNILQFFNSAEEAKEYEKLLITNVVIESNKYYNLMPGGTGGDGKGIYSRNYNRVFSEEHRKNISKSRKGRFKGEENPFYGKTHSDEMRLWMSERQQGELSHVYDHSVYQFYNHLTADEFMGTQYEFRKTHELDSGNVNRLIKGNVQSYVGWTLQGNIIPTRGPSPDDKFYTITNNHEIFSGTRKEIMKKLQTKDVSRFLRRKSKQCKGWILYDT